MGITGLIPFLEKASCPVNIRELQGSSVAVDSYCWLHKGVFACAEKLIRGETTDIYIQFCLKYVDMLTKNKIKVIMVFDGRHLPAKAETERKRREARNESKRLAKEYLRLNEIEKARSHMKRAIDVTHEMALELIKACRNRNIDCIVAPYEADAQMAWLSRKGLAEYIITEDSDLTLFGAQKILFKLDLTGQALLVQSNKLYMAMGCKPEKYTFDKFRRMCILSGCDYLDSLHGIGLKKACKFILTTEEVDMKKALKKIPSYLKMKNLVVTNDYIESFLKAEATFKHMFIYNPLERRMERLNALEDYQTDESYCSNAGYLLEDDEQAFQLAIGNLNPFTLKKLDDWHPDRNWSQEKNNHKSIWHNSRDETENNDDKEATKRSEKSAIFYFKKIEFKNMVVKEIEETLCEENRKLEESEIFSMYKYASPKKEQIKRRRQQSSSTSSDGEEHSDHNSCSNPKRGIHNPFARVTTTIKDTQKSPVCNNNSFLKLLSPQKLNAYLKKTESASVKSRFFNENIKQVAKKPFAARDLTFKMFEIEEKTSLYADQQKDLYSVSPQSTSEIKFSASNQVLATAESPDTPIKSNEENNIISEQNNDKVISLSDYEDEMQSQDFLSSSIPKVNTLLPQPSSKVSIRKNYKTTFKKSSKAIANEGTKQSRLSMFGFQKKPLLKKL